LQTRELGEQGKKKGSIFVGRTKTKGDDAFKI